MFNARDGAHDDILLALALACWRGERSLPVRSEGPAVVDAGAIRSADIERSAIGLLAVERCQNALAACHEVCLGVLGTCLAVH